MDVSMPVMDGIESTEQILKKLPKTKVLMLTASDSTTDATAPARPERPAT